MKKELSPVISSGWYICEHEKCTVQQLEDSKGNVLFYGDDDGMYCKKHITLYLNEI